MTNTNQELMLMLIIVIVIVIVIEFRVQKCSDTGPVRILVGYCGGSRVGC